MNLATVNVAESLNLTWDAKNHLATSNSAELGSSLKAKGDITLVAGQDVNARAAYVASDDGTGTGQGGGAIAVSAGRDITVTNGQATSSVEEDRYVEKKSNGFGPSGSLLAKETKSSKSTDTQSSASSTQVQASTFSADSITMSSGRDLTVTGSNVVATNDLSLSAKHDLTLTSAEQSSSTSQSKDEKRDGFGATGGISNGKKSVEQANTSSSTTQVGSSIGSINGNVTLSAGNNYRQTASNVQALGLRDKDGNLLQGGDISIEAADVRIDAAQDTSLGTQDSKFKQSGVSVTFSSPMVSALQGVIATADAADQTQDKRTQALAVGNTALAVYNLASTLTNASALNISLSVGSSSSQSHSEQSASIAETSSVKAGGNLSIKATGDATKGQGNITAIGAELSAGNNASLDASNDIDLRSAQNTTTQTSSNKSSSASVGIGLALGGTQNGFTINAAASQARGNSDGSDVTNTLSTVTARNGLTLNSGKDTKLIGATASGAQVTVTVGGDLDIQSVQDTSTFTSKESSAGVGVSLCIPPICYGASSGSVSASKGKVNGDFASVATQSGIQAGDSGFQINVKGNTNLKGAAITSSQTAVDQNKNSFSTDTVTQSEIENKDNYSASSLTASASYSTKIGDQSAETLEKDGRSDADKKAAKAPAGGMNQGIGVGSVSGNERSTTGNAISGATVTIRSGDAKALDGIDRTAVTETNTTNGLTKQWDGQKLGQETTLQAQLVQSVGQSAAKEIGGYFGQQAESLKAQAVEADKAGDTDRAKDLRGEAAKWDEGGLYRVAAHTSVGLLLGGADGAIGAGAAAQVAPLITDMQSGVQKSLQDAGMSPDAAKAVAAVIGTGTAAVIGAAAGGGNVSSAAMAFNVDANNRQLHPTEIQWIARNARGFAQQLAAQLGRPVTELEAMQWLTAAGQSDVDEAAQRSNGNFVRGPGFGEEAQAYDAAKAFIVGNSRGSAFTDERGQTQPLFTTKNGDFYKPEVYGQYRNDANYREYFWQVQGINLRPDNPTQQEQQQYDQRQSQLNAQIPKDLLLLAGPAALQAAVSRVGARGPNSNRTNAGDDVAAAPSPHAPAGDEPPPNVRDNQRPGVEKTPPQATDASAGGAYSSTGRPYGDTKTTDANGNPVPSGTNAQSTLNGMASKNVDSVNAPIDFDHIIGADYRRNPDGSIKVVGGQSQPTGGHSLVDGDVRVVPGSESAPDASGVYKARVEMPDPANPGQWLEKQASNHTMFPKDWSADRIKVEVDAAWNSPSRTIDGNKWTATTPSGVKIEGWLTPRVTAFPVKQP